MTPENVEKKLENSRQIFISKQDSNKWKVFSLEVIKSLQMYDK